MTYKVYFTDLTHTGLGVNANNFPLGVGLVAANAVKELKDHLDVSIYKYPEDLNQALSREMPHVLCMSNYAWNADLTYAFAEYVKRVHPETVVVFGGPNFPINPTHREKFLRERPAIDFHIKWDGEFAFASLMRKLMDAGMDHRALITSETISENACYLNGVSYIEGPNHRVLDLDGVPSPYLTGLFDKFFDEMLIPMMETTRGCPYSCTFCNDGNILRNRIYRKSEQRIREELTYIASKSQGTPQTQLFLTDLNFGMYRQDLDTANVIRSVIDDYGWPGRVETSTGKSQPGRLLQVTKIINEGSRGIIKLGYSFQSTDPTVLKEIKRKNLSVDDLIPMRDYRFEQINDNQEFFTELILALPGDNLDAHHSSLRNVIDVLGMNNIDIHQLTLLKGSEMADWAELGTRPQDQFDVHYRVFVGCLGIYDIGGETTPCAEIEDVVVGNSTLSFDDYLQCRIIHLLIKVYLDHDPFNEVFGLIRKLGLSSFDLLQHLAKDHLYNSEPLSRLIKSFVEGSKAPLFDTYGEAKRVATTLDNTLKYMSGEYGQNELLAHRVRAYLECNDEIHRALQESVLCYIESHGLMTPDIQRYVLEAIEFGRVRRFDLQDYETVREGAFSFDFLEAERRLFEVDPAEIKMAKTQYRFGYDKEEISTIQNLSDQYGTETLRQLGKLFQRNNLLLMKRKVLVKREVLAVGPVLAASAEIS